MFKHIIRIKFALLITATLLALSFVNLSIVYLFISGPLDKVTTLIITPYSSVREISIKLRQGNVVAYEELFFAVAKLYSLKHPLKSGEYMFTKSISPLQVLNILSTGKSIIHKLVIPEGLMVSEIIEKINSESRLFGEIKNNIPEGFLMPSTYMFSYGDTKEQIIDQMRKTMTLALDEAMIKLSPNSPLKTRLEVLTLASIIEKEAILDKERAIIAAVFLNRLRKGMKLQADPTSIYAVTEGKFKLTRALTKKDLSIVSPYNTYHIFSLPPGPISCPGVKSLMAVVSPASTQAIYFVVDGTGGHNFSDNIDQHNKYVEQYRRSKACH
ncbi:MAG: endolytic transglycosylase MltG [Janthinobacterium lividum]